MSGPDGSQPLVVVASHVPLISEALSVALGGMARVTWVPALTGDLAGLLRSLGADAVVVDSDATADALAATADRPLVHVELRLRRTRLLYEGVSTEIGDDSAEAIRNLLLGALSRKAASA